MWRALEELNGVQMGNRRSSRDRGDVSLFYNTPLFIQFMSFTALLFA